MSTKKPYVILAPHVDDEVIGCWRLLNDRQVSDVFYVNQVSDQRWQEALDCSREFGAVVHKETLDTPFIEYLHKVADKGIKILVPHWMDHHPEHKKLNKFVRSYSDRWSCRFYSVDMNVPGLDCLSELDSRNKYRSLCRLFLSQSRYIGQHQEVSLFEAFLENDWVWYQDAGQIQLVRMRET